MNRYSTLPFAVLRYIVRPWLAMFSFFLSRLAGRILRRVMGIRREPVRQLTEADLRSLDHAYALLVSLIAAGCVVAMIVTFYAGRTC